MTPRHLIAACVLLGAPLCASADTSYSFSTDPQTVAVGAVSGAITVSGTAAAAQTTCLLLSSSSGTGQFSSSATSWSAVSAVSMSKGSSNRSFYYQDPTAGAYTLTVRVAPKPDSVSSSCTSWSGAASAVVATITQGITVGSGAAPDQTQIQSPQTQQDAANSNSTTQTQSQSTGGVTVPAITARITTDAVAVVGAGTPFDGSAFGAAGQALSGARYLWNFGDGGVAEGAHVLHTYAYPGTYDVMLSVAYNYSSATARLALSAAAAQVSLMAEGDGSLTLYDLAGTDLDVGWWRLIQGTSTFTMPEGTEILAGKGVRFSPMALKFAGDETAVLYYPNGDLAAKAKVGMNSPLRGQMVEVIAPAQVSTAPVKRSVGSAPVAKAAKAATPAATSTINGGDEAAAAGMAPFGVEWMYYAGLFAIIAIGAAGAYYAHPMALKREETYGEADEFDIEE